MHRFSIELLGLRLAFSASQERAGLVERYMFPGVPRQPARPDDTLFHLDEDASSDEAIVLLQQAVDEHVVQHAAGFAFIHCGVVGLGGGAALLIAQSGEGKSTLVEALARDADYYSDEYAAIDAQGRLHPYPRSLLLREGRPDQRPATPAELGARVATAPADIRLALQIPYRPGARGIEVEPMGQSEALHLLLTCTPQALEDHPGIFQKLALVAAQARTFTGVRGEAKEAASAILDKLARC